MLNDVSKCITLVGRVPWMFLYEQYMYFVSLPIISFQWPAVGLYVWGSKV